MTIFLLLAVALGAGDPPPPPGPNLRPLFDGKTLEGWEGNAKLWRVEEGCITGGSLTEQVKQNDFLCTTQRFTNFILRLRFKLTGAGGFVNSGAQIRSERIPNHHEVKGYQCDIGDPDWWGCIYDESRRNRVLARSDMKALGPHIRRNDWNDYVIRADGPRLTVWLNGIQTVDWTEPDETIPDTGLIALQVHGGGKALIQVKEISIEERPVAPAGKFIGAPEPRKPPDDAPLSPEEEKALFSLPPGFEIELVAGEREGVGKPIAVTWDARGRMWTMTAVEYPVDANDDAARAEALYARPGRDKVLVFDNPSGPGPHTPRVFAEGFAIPLGLLPYKNGAYVQHGHEIVFVEDTDGDGRADRRETVLSGFGIHDSHLLPHQFTRAPGGRWIYFAQGAFNKSRVKTRDGAVTTYDATKLARFTPDGGKFEILTWGPCNIWGFVIDAQGETWMQEANDYGYSVVPYLPGGFYPGLGGQPKPYTPETPGLAEFRMGGTGLSGLALSDARGAFPGRYADVMYVANPVTRKIQSVRILRDGGRHQLALLPDFVQCGDPRFRPVAIQFGPDGCLYIVDFYNKVISHNEVPRNHPDRDKTRGRIWRVRHKDQPRIIMPDFIRLPEEKLIERLGSDITAQAHLAWQAIVDRGAAGLAPRLKQLVADKEAGAAARIQALWALEGLGLADASTLQPLLGEPNRNLRRETVRALGEGGMLDALESAVADDDPQVRIALIRAATPRAIGLLARLGREPLEGPTAPSQRDKRNIIKVREAFEREFERYLVRAALEAQPDAVEAFLASAEAQKLPVENRLLAALALEPRRSAAIVAGLLPQIKRSANSEELLRLAQHPDLPGVGEALQAVLRNDATRLGALQGLLQARNRLDARKIQPLLEEAARRLLGGDDKAAEFGLQLAGAFAITALEPEIAALAQKAGANQGAALQALRQIGPSQAEPLLRIFKESKDPRVRDEAVAALAALPQVLDLWPDLSAAQRRAALDRLSGSPKGARAALAAVRSGTIVRTELDGATLERLQAVLGDDAQLAELLKELDSILRPVLRFDGNENGWTEPDFTLDGPFTVETWIRLDPGITNADGILGSPGALDINFFDARFRVWVGDGINDAVIAKKPITAESWTHVAATRDEKGFFKLYVDGELDSDPSKLVPRKFERLRIGWTAAAGGSSHQLSEYRVWSRARTADEIRTHFDRALEGGPRPEGLLFHASGAGPWGKLQGTAKVIRVSDGPPLVTAGEAKALDEKFAKYREWAGRAGDPAKGKAAAAACMNCHLIRGEGRAIGPDLSGAGVAGVESLLRNIITPNAAIESGYRAYRVQLKSDDVLDGFLVSEEKDAFVLRQPNVPDARILKSQTRRAGFVRRSIMPENLLDALTAEQVADLFAFLKSLQ